ncbi:hypothetical protein FEM33_15525 [Dyadobacter flavalbus]|uniref:Uncharacterized protein n=1 Tax=Dyadobacter flavalbus TaxID=2579942 RepID=A0A5M8QU80_9BACT|nr:hypothetical protein [Dyadobacter flavalbus]KAA6438828.1 hypothetical protein FEM33_15525 [Dyadobacter flavalbus]
MTGTYQTIDGSIYEVFLRTMGKQAKPELMAKSIKSPVRTGEMVAFTLLTGQIERNVLLKLWTKIES